MKKPYNQPKTKLEDYLTSSAPNETECFNCGNWIKPKNRNCPSCEVENLDYTGKDVTIII